MNNPNQEREFDAAQLDDYHRAMMAQYEADAKDTSEDFAQEWADWRYIRRSAAVRPADDNTISP